MKPLLLLLLLAACSTNSKPPTKPINAVVHLNEESSPCGKLTRYDGCYAIVTGEQHIWYFENSPAYVSAHLRAFTEGMRHSMPWVWDWRYQAGCVTVLTPGGPYKTGDYICVGTFGEMVIREQETGI